MKNGFDQSSTALQEVRFLRCYSPAVVLTPTYLSAAELLSMLSRSLIALCLLPLMLWANMRFTSTPVWNGTLSLHFFVVC